jgi:hypothetical protein
MNIFYLDESGEAKSYFSLTDMRNRRYYEAHGCLHGCFFHNGHLGKITLKPFAVSVKSMTDDSHERAEFSGILESRMMSFIQHQALKRPDAPC